MEGGAKRRLFCAFLAIDICILKNLCYNKHMIRKGENPHEIIRE